MRLRRLTGFGALGKKLLPKDGAISEAAEDNKKADDAAPKVEGNVVTGRDDLSVAGRDPPVVGCGGAPAVGNDALLTTAPVGDVDALIAGCLEHDDAQAPETGNVVAGCGLPVAGCGSITNDVDLMDDCSSEHLHDDDNNQLHVSAAVDSCVMDSGTGFVDERMQCLTCKHDCANQCNNVRLCERQDHGPQCNRVLLHDIDDKTQSFKPKPGHDRRNTNDDVRLIPEDLGYFKSKRDLQLTSSPSRKSPNHHQDTFTVTSEDIPVVSEHLCRESLSTSAFIKQNNFSRITSVTDGGTVTGFVCERMADDTSDSRKDCVETTVAETTLMSCFTEIVPDLDLEALPPGVAEEELSTMASQGSFNAGSNGYHSNGNHVDGQLGSSKSKSLPDLKGNPNGNVGHHGNSFHNNHDDVISDGSNGYHDNENHQSNGVNGHHSIPNGVMSTADDAETSGAPLKNSDMNGNSRPPLRKRSTKKSLKPNLRAIREDKELSVDKLELDEFLAKPDEDEDEDDSSSPGSPMEKPPLMKKWSNTSSVDSIDDGYVEEEMSPLPSSNDPDVMAADSNRRGSGRNMRNRRTGFSFNLGDSKVPANAFCDGGGAAPKFLTVTEMMMKLHMPNAKELPTISHRRLSAPDIGLMAELDRVNAMKEKSEKSLLTKAKTIDGAAGSATNVSAKPLPRALTKLKSGHTRFSLVGFRDTQPDDIKNELDFLDFPTDQRLNLTALHRALLLRFNPVVRFVIGLLFGIVLGVVIRHALTHRS